MELKRNKTKTKHNRIKSNQSVNQTGRANISTTFESTAIGGLSISVGDREIDRRRPIGAGHVTPARPHRSVISSRDVPSLSSDQSSPTGCCCGCCCWKSRNRRRFLHNGNEDNTFFYNVRSLPAKKNWFLRNIHFRANKKKSETSRCFHFQTASNKYQSRLTRRQLNDRSIFKRVQPFSKFSNRNSRQLPFWWWSR